MKIAVIGLGLIGASMAKALSTKARIIGIDRNETVVRRALADGVIHNGSTDLLASSGCDMVVLALPVGSIVQAARTIIPRLTHGETLTDTGSTKAHIVKEVEAIFGSFVGSHPIAGKENPGYEHSDASLFTGAMTIMTPTPSTRPECMEKVRALWEMCGSSTATMDPDTHDRLMAKISHLPHLLSYTSMALARDLTIYKELLGAGFRDFTRIAASDPVMWRDIFLDNRENILPLIDEYIEELERLRSLVRQGMAHELEEALARYARIRRELYARSR